MFHVEHLHRRLPCGFSLFFCGLSGGGGGVLPPEPDKMPALFFNADGTGGDRRPRREIG